MTNDYKIIHSILAAHSDKALTRFTMLMNTVKDEGYKAGYLDGGNACDAQVEGYKKGFIDGSNACGEQAEELKIEEIRGHVIESLEWVLTNCSGGGNWRRKIEQRIKELKNV